MDELPVFRAGKRRRLVQPKDENSVLERSADGESDVKDSAEVADDEEINVSELLRLRKLNKRKGIGIQFQNQKRGSDDEETSDMALTNTDPEQERIRDISDRFIGSTGQVVDVDRHMMAYIDSEMAKRQNVNTRNLTNQQTPSQPHQQENKPQAGQSKLPDFPTQAQLSEFDLGLDAQQKNLARTTAAIARASSGLPTPAEDSKPRRPRKPRLGRDGKPLRPRPRKRRNSSDIARDALVEQMLHEHKMDVYEDDQGGSSGRDEDDSDADERLAEQFRQQFMEAMTERQQKNQVKAATAARAKGVGPDQSGPKLGGSRSARAKMALMQQQQQGQGQK